MSDKFFSTSYSQSTVGVNEHALLREREIHTLRHFGLAPGASFLELGCAEGDFVDALAKEVPGLEITGVCPRTKAMEHAKTFVLPKIPTLELVVAPPWSSGLEDARFDFVYHRFMRHAKIDAWEIIQEAYRLAKPGGIIGIAAADADWVTAFPDSPALATIRGIIWDEVWSHTGPPRSGRAVGSLLLKAGLDNVRMQTFSISTCEVGIFDWLDTFIGPWLHQLPNEQADFLSDSLATELSAKDAVGMGSICIAAGVKR